MKQLIIIITLILSLNVSGQITYGYNGTNVPENLTPYVIDLLDAQVPIGETFVLCFRNDKYATQAPDADINNVIALRDKLVSSGKGFTLIYTFNARATVTIEQNFYALNKFEAAGINIMAVRLGNEEFFKEAGHASNFNTYLSKNTALLAAIEADPYTLIIPVADPDWLLWNPDAINFINAKATRAPDIHFYFDKKAVPIIGTMTDKTLPAEKVTGYLPAKQSFYSDLYFQTTTSGFYDEMITFCKEKFPTKKIYITEYGPATGPGEIGGTLGYEAATDWFLNKTKDESIIAALCRFNGPSLTGVITPVSKNDAPNANGYIPRLGYYTISNFLKHDTNFKEAPGEYVINYHNMTPNPVNIESVFNLPENLYIETYSFEGIQGQYFYSSSGACSWWSKGSDKTYEINGTKTLYEIPAMSYGYISVTIQAVPVYGCTDPLANNYNPEATVNEGCTYDIRGCTDKTALNYDPNATINEGCEYAPVECFRERILFKSLGCKKVKTNCNCK